MKSEMENYYIASICLSEKIGCTRAKHLLNHFGSGKAVWEASNDELEETKLTKSVVESLINFRQLHPCCPEQIFEYCSDKEIKLCSINDSGYPKILKDTKDAPILIYYRGEIRANENRIAIVGTRRPTPYGKRAAFDISERLSKEKVTIVSGAAYGIDMQAHLGALKYGRTVAVLGNGLEIPLSYERERLLEKIVANGGVVLSEYSPNTLPSKGTFPHRNRIIAGLSIGVLVVEAGKDSGAMNTAQHAGEYGRLIFALPGNIYSEKSEGCHELIRDGAILIRNANDILEDCKLSTGSNKDEVSSIIGLMPLEGDEQIVAEVIPTDVAISADEISMKLDNMELSKITNILLQLEMRGYISIDDFGNYVRSYGKI